MAEHEDEVAKKLGPEEVDASTRRRAVKQLHEQRSKERKERQMDRRLMYQALKGEPVLEDLMTTLKSFSDYHTRLAKDGVGAIPTGGRDENGNPLTEISNLPPERRLSELDKSVGIEEIIAYLERQTADEVPTPTKLDAE